MKNALAVLALSAAAALPAAAQGIPDHPSKLSFKSIAFTPPVPKDYRVVLKNGMAVFM